MTDLQKKFLELANQKEQLVSQLKEIDPLLEELMLEIGKNNYFQSDEGLVYKIQEPKGTFISFKKIEYVRTKKEGEFKGSLSKKEAEENGFDLKK